MQRPRHLPTTCAYPCIAGFDSARDSPALGLGMLFRIQSPTVTPGYLTHSPAPAQLLSPQRRLVFHLAELKHTHLSTDSRLRNSATAPTSWHIAARSS